MNKEERKRLADAVSVVWEALSIHDGDTFRAVLMDAGVLVACPECGAALGPDEDECPDCGRLRDKES